MRGLREVVNELIPVMENKEGNYLVSAKQLYKFLKIGKDFSSWIKNQLELVDANEDIDYSPLKGKTSKIGGRPSIDYVLTIDIAKEICMIAGIAPHSNEDTRKLSKQARRYFIDIEKKYKASNRTELKRIARREAGKIVRNMLTDAIKEKIPDSPHKKFAYPNYTKLIYKILFNKTAGQLREEKKVPKKKSLRDYFNPDELKEVQELENIITGLISLGMGYNEIKDILNQKYIKKIA